MSNQAGVLYVVATPIGNLEDITHRAVRVLSEVDLIAAEDTRHSRKLLQHYGIVTATTALHEHNERTQIKRLLDMLRAGKSIALVSDAGTPLISDPGSRLVQAMHAAGIRVVPIPGPCAAVAALSAAGLVSDRFVFEGFPPAKSLARTAFFEALKDEHRTLIFYEAPHRIVESLQAMAAVFGRDRPAVLARELTKRFETIRQATLGEICDWLVSLEAVEQRGEYVVLLASAARAATPENDVEGRRVLRILLRNLPLKTAVTLAAQITGSRRQALYRMALALKRDA